MKAPPMYQSVDPIVQADSNNWGSSGHGQSRRLALIGGFAPRRCGIATFTVDMADALQIATPDLAIDIYAMAPAVDTITFDSGVKATILQDDPASFRAAAALIESNPPVAVWLQHEFGLFGGAAGELIFELVDRISAPLIVTLHTVLANPNPDQRRVMQRLVARASKLVVMSQTALELLYSVYGADQDQAIVIPHGVPDRPFGRSAMFKQRLNLDGHRVLMTFGLLSPGKGIEAVIAALPSIVGDHPDVVYCIVGATHPNLIAREGEAYRERLHAMAVSLGVEQHIRWSDMFLPTEDLLDFIEAADVYITPYPGAGQSTSGTLSYALALGKAIVSTPYLHASELLADAHGLLVPFNDSAAIAVAVGDLLDDPARLLDLQHRAYARGRNMLWSGFAARSLGVIATVEVPRPSTAAVGPIGIEGLLRLCDSTGILQHSIHCVPDRAHGYCVDDNARALMLANRLGKAAEPHRTQLTTIFAAFVQNAWNDDTRQFRNFMGFGRNWLEDFGSQDSGGRTLWALGATGLEGRNPALRRWAIGLFERSGRAALAFGSPRAIAFAMLGSDHVLAASPTHAIAREVLEFGAEKLADFYDRASSQAWPWFEASLAYDNARLAEALIRAGITLSRPDLIARGTESLNWLVAQQTSVSGNFRPVGSDSFGDAHEPLQPFDQQPVEAWATIDACAAAFGVRRDPRWVSSARQAYQWFSGGNDRGVVVGDRQSGSCHDGINPRGLNLNEGAESVLAYQLATISMQVLLAKASCQA